MNKGLRIALTLCVFGALLPGQNNQQPSSPTPNNPAPSTSAPGNGGGGAQLNPAATAPQAPPFVTCPAGSPLGPLNLQVEAGVDKLPYRTINRLSEEDTLLYAPILRGKEKRTGEIALVLVPEKRQPGEQGIIVTDPRPADKPQSWKMSQTISLVALVYGPAGLNRKKVASFLSRDEVLIGQLADYADKTAQAEQLVATLSNSESSSASVNAALNGFASQYGFAVQVDRTAPPSAQAATVFSAMNPQLAMYNPLASSTAQRAGQTASLATMAGSLFFGSPVGLAAGGTAMLLDLRSIAFPDTQFRASFAQPLTGVDSGVNLCGQQGPVPPHTRVAYIWASRVPNIPLPTIKVGTANYLPAGQKAALPVEVPELGWKYLERARAWALQSKDKKVTVPVVKLGNQKALELDLTKATLTPGEYDLTGLWDWTPLRVTGTVHVMPLSDFQKAHVDPTSQDKLLAKSGKVPVTLSGADFEFTEKVELTKPNDEFAVPEAARFKLPKGLRMGPQDGMDVQIDTQNLDAGTYSLLISQQDGKAHGVNFQILPNPPRIDNLPILANQGAGVQHFVLKGERLQQVKKLEAAGVILGLVPGNDQNERNLTVELKSSPKPGTALPISLYIENHSEPITLPGALQITGPLPVIASSRISLPAGMAVAVRADEFPAGYTLNVLMDVRNIQRKGVLRLGCSDGVGTTTTLHIGGQTATWALQQLSPDQLYLAFDTTGVPAGCSLQATLDNGRDGSSQPATLAHILRIPLIDTFTPVSTAPVPASAAALAANQSTASAPRPYQITGQNLEMIEKVGWDETTGNDVGGLPTPLPGPGLKQSLHASLPDPPTPDAALYVWLRGDTKGRVTTIKAPSPPRETETTPAGTISVTTQPPATSTTQAAAGTGAASTGKAIKILTTTVLKSTPNPSAAGQAATFTVVVASSGGGTPSGMVTLMAGKTALGAGTLDASGSAVISSSLTAGTYIVQAVYGGSADHQASTSPALTQVVH